MNPLASRTYRALRLTASGSGFATRHPLFMIFGKPEDRWTPFKAVWPVLYATFLSGFVFRSIMLHATNGNTIAVAGSSVSLAALVVYGLAYLWYFNKRKN